MQRDYNFIIVPAIHLHRRSNSSSYLFSGARYHSVSSQHARATFVMLNSEGDGASKNSQKRNSANDLPLQHFGIESSHNKLHNEEAHGNSYPGNILEQKGDGTVASEMDTKGNKILDNKPLDGSISTEMSDKHFLDALSKGWDNLSQFDPDVEPLEPDEEGLPVTPADAPLNPHESLQSSDTGSITPGDSETESKSRKHKKGSRTDSKAGKIKAKANQETSKRRARSTKDPSVVGPEELIREEKLLRSTPRWYFVQVKPGCENSVATAIRNLALSIDGDKVIDVMVPLTKTLRLSKSGASEEKDERYFPGYILVLMLMDRISYGHIKRVPHVQSFMGDPNDNSMNKDQPFRPPSPVSDVEIRTIFEKLQDVDVKARQAKIGLQLGDIIRVVSGSMEGAKGKVIGMKPDLDVVSCRLMLFGRDSLIDLSTSQIELYDENKARLEEGQKRRKEETQRNDRFQHGRRRLDSSFAKVGTIDYSNAEVSSAADELSQLLLDDDDDSWDPLADLTGRKKEQKREANGERTFKDKHPQIESDYDVNQQDEEFGDTDGFQDATFLVDGDDEANLGDEFGLEIDEMNDCAEDRKNVKREKNGKSGTNGIESDDSTGLVDTDDELEEFLRQDENVTRNHASDLYQANTTKKDERRRKGRVEKAGHKAPSKARSNEIDPELKMVLDEIDEELDAEEGFLQENEIRSTRSKTKTTSSFTKEEGDNDGENDDDWLMDTDSFAFNLDGVDESTTSSDAGEEEWLELDLNTNKGKRKENEVKAVDPEKEILYSMLEENLSTDLDDIGDEIVTFEGADNVEKVEPNSAGDFFNGNTSDADLQTKKKSNRKPPKRGQGGRKRSATRTEM